AGNYEQSPKLVERDFHDIFFQFGILGTILLLAPFIYYAINILSAIFLRRSLYVNVKYILLFTSIILGLAISFTGGHIFFSPAVSTYLSFVLAYLVVIIKRKKDIYYE